MNGVQMWTCMTLWIAPDTGLNSHHPIIIIIIIIIETEKHSAPYLEV
jgi:hypothetical protein